MGGKPERQVNGERRSLGAPDESDRAAAARRCRAEGHSPPSSYAAAKRRTPGIAPEQPCRFVRCDVRPSSSRRTSSASLLIASTPSSSAVRARPTARTEGVRQQFARNRLLGAAARRTTRGAVAHVHLPRRTAKAGHSNKCRHVAQFSARSPLRAPAATPLARCKEVEDAVDLGERAVFCVAKQCQFQRFGSGVRGRFAVFTEVSSGPDRERERRGGTRARSFDSFRCVELTSAAPLVCRSIGLERALREGQVRSLASARLRRRHALASVACFRFDEPAARGVHPQKPGSRSAFSRRSNAVYKGRDQRRVTEALSPPAWRASSELRKRRGRRTTRRRRDSQTLNG